MKQITRLEPSDIDLKGDKLHGLLHGSLAVIALLMTSPPREGEATAERVERIGVVSVMTFLNVLSEAGYVISKKEDIPSAFISEG